MSRRDEIPHPTFHERRLQGIIPIINLTGMDLSEIVRFLPHQFSSDPEFAKGIEKLILLSDIGPTEPTIMPVGSCVTLSPEIIPNWRELAVSDVHCGFTLVTSEISKDDFNNTGHPEWDKLCETMIDAGKSRYPEPGTLGGGNHFIDAVDVNGLINFVIHTGSFGKDKEILRGLTTKPTEFDQAYATIATQAIENRTAIFRLLKQLYGASLQMTSDKPHNFIEIDNQGMVTIYKGAQKIAPGEKAIVPASMGDVMTFISGLEGINNLRCAINHGTGRVGSRGSAKLSTEDAQNAFDLFTKKIYVPKQIHPGNICTEMPHAYRKADTFEDSVAGKNLIETYAYGTVIAVIAGIQRVTLIPCPA